MNKELKDFLEDDDEQQKEYQLLEEIKLDDELFEMSKLVNIKKMLSIKKKKNSKVIIMNKYYMQIPNHFEEENIDEEAAYMSPEGKDQLQLIENEDGTAEIVRLDEIYQLCTFFNIEIKIQAEIYRQYFKIKPIYANEARQLCHYKNIIDVIKVASTNYINEQFEKFNMNSKNQIEVKNKIIQILLKFNQIYPNIFDLQFAPTNLDDLEDKVIKGQLDLLSKQEINNFNVWRQYQTSPIVTVNKCFFSKYDCRNQLTGEQLQDLVNRQLNQINFNHKAMELSQYGELEENYFNVSIRPMDYINPNKIYLHVRQNNGNIFLATKNNNENFFTNLFTKYLNNSDYLLSEDKEFDDIAQHQFQKLYFSFFAIGIKDFLMNIDYKLIESLGQNKLAKYLKERKLFYIDPFTNKEIQIENNNSTKGIFFGEVFATDIATIICGVIAKILKEKFLKFTNIYQINVLFSQQSFLVRFIKKNKESQMVDENEDITIAQALLKTSIQTLQDFGFEHLPSSVRYNSFRDENIILLKLDQNREFVKATDFPFMGKNLVDLQPKVRTFTEEQIKYLTQLLEQYKSKENIDQSVVPQYQALVSYINLRLTKRYVRHSIDKKIDKGKVNSIFKQIYQNVDMPFFKNKVPFFD